MFSPSYFATYTVNLFLTGHKQKNPEPKPGVLFVLATHAPR